MLRHDRVDRAGIYTAPVWLGLFITGIYVIATPESTTVDISNWADNLLGVMMTLAAGACLYGVTVPNWRAAYQIQICGLSVIVVVLGILAMVTRLTLVQQFTLVGGLGALVQIGSIRAIWVMWQALRHDHT